MVRPTRPLDVAAWPSVDWTTRPLGDRVDQIAHSSPDRLAIVDGEHRLSYRELRRRVINCAERFRALGISPGDVVLVQLPNWWEANVTMLALLRLGAIPNPVVPIYRERELAFIIHQSTPRAVVVPHRFRKHDYLAMFERLLASESMPGGRPTVVVVRPDGDVGSLEERHVIFDVTGRSVGSDAAQADADRASVPAVDDVALVLYTSGTTADPKGVLHDHRTLEIENRTIIDLFGLDADSAVFMPSPVRCGRRPR